MASLPSHHPLLSDELEQIIAGRYVVIQYLGSGTFCHTVQCEDLQGRGQHRFVCVKVSKNTKDILDQNLWEVKLLKMLCDLQFLFWRGAAFSNDV